MTLEKMNSTKNINDKIILPKESQIYKALEGAQDKRLVFFTGLSGVGKSLYIQQFAKMAANAGRVVHLLQWDVTREAFQNECILKKYPEVDGVTHAVIRKAVGLWTRQGILDWHKKYNDPKHILIGELPLIGNRLVEVVQKHQDEVEPLLSSDQTEFFLPVPSKQLREHIVGCRTSTIDMPSHQRESSDAPPSVVESHWQEIRDLASLLKIIPSTPKNNDYDPSIYCAAYEYLLKHRHASYLMADKILPTVGSVYELDVVETEISAKESEVKGIFEMLEQKYSTNEVEELINNWWRI